MPDLVLPKGTYQRSVGDMPPFVLVNMYAEETASAKGGVSLQSWPGLESIATRGTGPINGIYRKADLFNGDIFSVSNGTLYRDSTSLGAINGSGPVSWANTNTELVVTRGQTAYSYNGTNLAAISFPDGANVTAVTALAERVIFARASSYRFYWSDLLDARTVGALNYASAESSADWLRDVLAIGETLYLGGGDTIEAWFTTGDVDLPYRRISQRTAPVGVAATGCMVAMDNALHFIGSDRVAYRMGDVPGRISHNGIEESLNASTGFAAFPMIWNGHPVFYCRLDTETLGFDIATGQWHERATEGLSNWVAGCCTQRADGTPIFGSAVGDDLLEHSGWAEGTSNLVRTLTAAIPADNTIAVDEVELEANTGVISAGSATVEMRFSKDRGHNWSPWRAVSLGSAGDYRARPRWRRLGYVDSPGALLQFRCSDATDFRVSGSAGQESSAGRNRT